MALRGYALALNNHLFPFNSRRRFAGDVVDHPVHAGNFIDDSPGDCIEGTEVTHDTDAADIGQAGEILPDTAVKAGFRDFLTEDGIRFTDDGELFFRDFAEDADGKTRPREGLAPYKVARDAEFLTDGTDFIFKEGAQGFISFGRPPTL